MPLALSRGVISATAAELPHPNGREAGDADFAPELVPNTVHVGGEGRVAEPGLVVDARSVVVGRVDHLVGDVEHDRDRRGVEEAAAPPVRAVGARVVDALHEDQPVRVHRQDRVARPFGCLVPVRAGRGGPPGGAAVRLVVEVCADDGGLVQVARGQGDPVADPLGFGHAARVPQLALAVRVGAVPVEDDVQSEFGAAVDQIVQHVQRVLVGQARVCGVVDAVRRGVADDVVAPRDTKTVEAQVLDLGQDALHADRPQSVQDQVTGFEPEPADALENGWYSLVQNHTATGRPSTPLC